MSKEGIGMIGKFYTTSGFFFRGELLAETETHYKIHDIKTNRDLDLLKTTVERVAWEV